LSQSRLELPHCSYGTRRVSPEKQWAAFLFQVSRFTCVKHALPCL
jgi:hypothetical protein